MALVELSFPAGITRPGTIYAARGRWYDCNLVRWFEKVLQPLGGWRELSGVDGAGPVRGLFGWRANDNSAHLLIGTTSKLWHYAGGTLTDITPVGFTAGKNNASYASGVYGGGLYGAGVYGSGESASQVLVPAQSWQIDNFGEDAVACAYSDGLLYYYDTSASSLAAVTGAPTDNVGVVVTPERFLVALGANGNGRTVKWASQETTETWTEESTNTAGEFDLTTGGRILAGLRSRQETLIWTTEDLHAMRYIGGTFVFSFTQLGAACGAISARSMAAVDGRAIWMGRNSFFTYDGFVAPLPCEVGDYVFGDINRDQRSKIACDVRSDYGEVTWYYPSRDSYENNRYVTFNYRENVWTIGELQRTAGIDRGPFPYALAADASGQVYEHEVEDSYLDVDGVTSLTPYIESGPFEIASGDRVMDVNDFVPDENTLGDVQATIYSALHPTGAERTFGPFNAAEPTNVRVNGRQVRLKLTQVNAGWRFGSARLDVRPGGRR